LPHLNIEYTANIADAFDAPRVLRHLNNAVIATGLFEPSHIKSRAVMFEQFCIGAADAEAAMIHARIHVLPGRAEEALCILSSTVVTALQAVLKPTPLTVQITAEVTEMNARRYAKVVVSP
jgi:5-carboxymethyl-2-hydroxymuconate isomerase